MAYAMWCVCGSAMQMDYFMILSVSVRLLELVEHNVVFFFLGVINYVNWSYV